MKLLEGKVALITGAGRGLGREEALLMAEHGCNLVINDLGVDRDAQEGDTKIADQVVEEIKRMGGKAIANYDSVSDFNKAKAMIDQAIGEFGKLDIIVNNAGVLRDGMIFKMSEADWDLVIDVHLKGTFNLCRHASVYFRELGKAGKLESKGRIINTSSNSGLGGNIGQSNYGAAKAGIAAFSLIIAQELKKYCTVNTVVPSAATRMTLGGAPQLAMLFQSKNKSGVDIFNPKYFTPLIVYLASDQAEKISGETFYLCGDECEIYHGWTVANSIHNNGQPFTVELLSSRFKELIEGVKTKFPFDKIYGKMLKR